MFVAVFCFSLLHLGAYYSAVSHHERRRALGFEGLGLQSVSGSYTSLMGSSSSEPWTHPKTSTTTRLAQLSLAAIEEKLTTPDSHYVMLMGVRVHYQARRGVGEALML
jgi:hypothetical protein